MVSIGIIIMKKIGLFGDGNIGPPFEYNTKE